MKPTPHVHTSRSSTGWPAIGRAAFQPRFIPGERQRQARASRLAVLGLVLLIGALWLAYRIATAEIPAPKPEPSFRGTFPEPRAIALYPSIRV